MTPSYARWLVWLALASTISTVSCYRGSEPEGLAPPDTGDEPVPPGEPLCSGEGVEDVPGPRLLRRLTAAEYEASVRYALGLDADAWNGPMLPPDPAAETGYTNDAERLRVGDAYAAALEQSAQQIATMVSGPEHLAVMLPCANEGGTSCASSLLDIQARRLFRRSLDSTERERYLALLGEVDAAGEGFDQWVRWTIQTLLQSPHFVYRSELGDPSELDEGWFDLRGDEVATFLAFVLTGGPPDDALLDRAEGGEFDSPEAIAAIAAELAFEADGSPRATLRKRLQEFHSQWLGLSTLANAQKDPGLYPGFTEQVKASMADEIEAFVSTVVFENRGDVVDLLTHDSSELDATLASYYGYGDGTGAATKPDGWGVGLLSLGGVMATHSTYLATSPTQRGMLVRSRLLCTELPPPPPDVGDLPAPQSATTTRQRYEEHATNPACNGCHMLVDPIGFGLEGLDAAGRLRTSENGAALDLRGTVQSLDGHNVAFEGATELADALADAETPAQCMAAHMATFALGMPPEDTECVVGSSAAGLAAGDVGIMDAYVAITHAPHAWRRQNR